MSETTTEADVRAVAAEFPTPAVRRAVALAESGELSWEQVASLFETALVQATEAVKAEQ